MKLQKNKIVFVMVMVCMVLFTVVYAMFTFGKDKEDVMEPDRIPIPDLEGSPVEYESKLEAIEAIKEERDIMAPQLYPDHMVDDKGYFNPDYMEYEKHRIIDSVYRSRSVPAKSSPSEKNDAVTAQVRTVAEVPNTDSLEVPVTISIQELALSHQLFFASQPRLSIDLGTKAHVDGNQMVKEGHRLAMRLDNDMRINGQRFPRGSRIYGFVTIRPNRVLLDIVRVGEHQVKLKVYDLQDGKEGIYVENQLKGEILESGLDATLGEINVPGIPQVSGIKRIFQRNNRTIKVEIKHRYQIKLVHVP